MSLNSDPQYSLTILSLLKLIFFFLGNPIYLYRNDISNIVTVRMEILPEAVVSERVPASSDEELGAWPDRPRL